MPKIEANTINEMGVGLIRGAISDVKRRFHRKSAKITHGRGVGAGWAMLWPVRPFRCGTPAATIAHLTVYMRMRVPDVRSADDEDEYKHCRPGSSVVECKSRWVRITTMMDDTTAMTNDDDGDVGDDER